MLATTAVPYPQGIAVTRDEENKRICTLLVETCITTITFDSWLQATWILEAFERRGEQFTLHRLQDGSYQCMSFAGPNAWYGEAATAPEAIRTAALSYLESSAPSSR